MLLFDAFKPTQYAKVEALGYYTPVGDKTTIRYKIGKQSPSCVAIPTVLAKLLKVEAVENKKYFTDLPEDLYVHKDPETGFKTLRLKAEEEDVGED